jgi:hypothetical protein
MLSVSERRLRLDMDITVTRAADCRRAWTLTDLLGRPLGSILEEPGRRFFIDPEGRGAALMAKVDRGPHPSLEEALTAIEKHAPCTCRLVP